MSYATHKSLIALTLALALAPEHAQAQTNRFVIETSRYRAEFVGALMVSFQNKLAGNVEMLDPPPAYYSFAFLLMATVPEDRLDRAATDTDTVVRDGSDYVVTYRQANPEAGYRLRIAVDPATEDLVLRTTATTSQPLWKRILWLHPEHSRGRLLLAHYGGICLPSTTPPELRMLWGSSIDKLGAPALLYERTDHVGGFALWVHSGDTRRLFSMGVYDFWGDDRRSVTLEDQDWSQPAQDVDGLEVRLNAYTGNWSHGLDLLKHRAFAPIDNHPPNWLRELRLVFNIPHLRWPNAASRIGEISEVMERANATFPRARALQSRQVLLHHNDWSADGHDRNFPDFSLATLPGDTEPSSYRNFATEAKAAGYPIMPQFNSCGAARFQTVLEPDNSRILGDHWAWLAYKDSIIRMWDGSQNSLVGWQVSGSLGPGSFYSVSLGNGPFRTFLRDRVLQVAAEVGAEAVYLDMSQTAWNAGDSNSLNFPCSGTNWYSFRELVSNLQAAGKVVAGEMNCWQTIKAGQQLAQVFPTGAKDHVSDFSAQYKFSSAFLGCLLSDSEIFYGHLSMPSPDAQPENFFRQSISCFMQGALLHVWWPAVPYGGVYEHEADYDHRGKVCMPSTTT